MPVRRAFRNVCIATAILGCAVTATPDVEAASGVSGVAAGQWTYFAPTQCFQQNFAGGSYLYIYNFDNTVAWTSEPDLVAGFMILCAFTGVFYVYSADGVEWSYTTYPPLN